MSVGDKISYAFPIYEKKRCKQLDKGDSLDGITILLKRRPLRKPTILGTVNEVQIKDTEVIQNNQLGLQINKTIAKVQEGISSLNIDNSSNYVLQIPFSSKAMPGSISREGRKQCISRRKQCNNKSKLDGQTKVRKENDLEQSNNNFDTNPIEQKQACKKLKRVPANHVKKDMFDEYLPMDVIMTRLHSQDRDVSNLVSGYLRINPKYHQHAYVTLSDDEQDIMIVGVKNRNRALEGDMVAVEINPKDMWHKLTQNNFQKTGCVVGILEKVNPRKVVGFLKKKNDDVMLQPRDSRLPMIRVDQNTVPGCFFDNPESRDQVMVVGSIIYWNQLSHCEGQIEAVIGCKGNLKSESMAILFENDLHLDEYDDSFLSDLPPPNYQLTSEDLEDREDLRKLCVFTIDPLSVDDLDDALSCRLLENGNYEVGIHIADVTHFLRAFSPLDLAVSERSTSVYMVERVYHMLPEQLWRLCTLKPGKDKLTFSVIIEITSNAEIVQHRFAKTVINSCCQVAYEQAQIMIESTNYDLSEDDSLDFFGNGSPSVLKNSVKNLHRIALQLRKQRIDKGALRIDQPKLSIVLDKATGIPTSFRIDERNDSKNLVEEFMLLANMLVARQLYGKFPELALLRSHAEPSRRLLAHFYNVLKNFGIILDTSSSGALNRSLVSLEPDPKIQSTDLYYAAKYRLMVINNLCAKSMMRAMYRNSLVAKSEYELKHYALSADFYTHFTSPIRRYPDCVVHRLLLCSISDRPLPKLWNPELCKKVASNANVKKYAAKNAQEQSVLLYLTYYLHLNGMMDAYVIVMDVKERSVDTMVCDIGVKMRLYFADAAEKNTVKYAIEHDVPIAYLTWVDRKFVQKVTLFTVLYVKLIKHRSLYKLHGIILPLLNIGYHS